MLLLLTISVENLTGYNDIVRQIALCTLNLPDQPTKRERVLKNNNVVCLFFLCSKMKTRYVNAVKMFLSIYSIHTNFPTFDIKVI